ncbi:MAG: hypothetical protein WBR18_03030 [Anaerolineales bacterium]
MRWTTGRVVAVSALAMLIMMVVFLPRADANSEMDVGQVSLPDITFFYGPAHVDRFAEAQGPSGREQYVRDRLTLDIVFPIAYGLFIASATASGFRRAFPHRLWLAQLGWVGLAAMSADIAENLLLSAIMVAYPRRIEPLSWLATATSAVKWVLVFLGMALAVSALIAWGWTAWRRRRAHLR